QQTAGLQEVGRFEALRELRVGYADHITCFVAPALTDQQPRQFRRCPQLPRQCRLTTRASDRLVEQPLRASQITKGIGGERLGLLAEELWLPRMFTTLAGQRNRLGEHAHRLMPLPRTRVRGGQQIQDKRATELRTCL